MKIPQYINLIIYNILIISTIIVISSTNIFIIWISLELNIFSFVPLLISKSTYNETETSINYFLAQSLGSTIFLFSIFSLIRLHLFIKFNTILITISILLKIGTFPCHYWFPTTIEKTRWVNCLILSTWQKIAPLFIILYVIKLKTSSDQTLISIISSLNAITGGLIGLRQTSLKKVIAYSSITHIGWILRRLRINTPCISVAYFIVYSIIITPLFIFFNKTNINKIIDLWDKQKYSILWNISIIITLLSLGGLPPLTGFMPKLLFISILLNYSTTIILILIIGSLINLFFYINIRINILIRYQENNNKKINISINIINYILITNFLGFILILL